MHGNLITRELSVGLFSFLSLVLSHTGNDLKILGEPVYPHTGSHRKQPPQGDSQEKERADTGTTSVSSESGEKVEGVCPCLSLVLSAERPKSSKTNLASLVCWAVLLALPLVVRFGR